MNDIVQWARLDDLSSAIEVLTWPDPSYMYLERIPAAWLTEAEAQNGLRLEKLNPAEDWNGWERGRLFCADFELRWEKPDGAFHAVYIGPPVDLPGFTHADDLDLSVAKKETRTYLLWGRRLPDDQLEAAGAQKGDNLEVFVEFQVPRLLHYPVSAKAQQVRLQVCEYTDLQTGVLCYYRFQGLEEVP